MPATSVRLTSTAADDQLVHVLAALPTALGLSRDFPPEVIEQADEAVGRVVLPDRDLTDVEFATIDPEGSTDLDQAFFLAREGAGMRFLYAIADVPAFVTPGGLIDQEARQRGQTIYAPDGRIPLHPTVISEGAASLLPDQLRGAFVWDFLLDANGVVTTSSVARARVKSRRQLDYVGVQKVIDDGTADGMLKLLPEFGAARSVLERARGGANLNTPETLIEPVAGGGYQLVRRTQLPDENWNSQLSLLTGMAGADIMLKGGVGILRTMPPAPADAIDRFRRQTRALGTPWAESQPYGEYLASLDGRDGKHLAILHAAASLFRGAGYTPFDGAPPAETMQSAVGAPYAHVTAPLRRLVDRFGLVICEALSTGAPVPQWARDALPELPKLMARSSNVSGQLDRRALDAVEAAILAPRVGETFAGSVIALNKTGSVVQLTDPAVVAECEAVLPLGADVTVRLVTADVPSATVKFAAV